MVANNASFNSKDIIILPYNSLEMFLTLAVILMVTLSDSRIQVMNSSRLNVLSNC